MLKDKDQFQIEIINSQEVYQIQEGKTSGAFWLASASVAIGGLQTVCLLCCTVIYITFQIYMGFFPWRIPLRT